MICPNCSIEMNGWIGTHNLGIIYYWCSDCGTLYNPGYKLFTPKLYTLYKEHRLVCDSDPSIMDTFPILEENS